MQESLPLLDRPLGWDGSKRDREFEDTEESEELYKAMCRDLIKRWDDSGLFSEGWFPKTHLDLMLINCRGGYAGLYKESQEVDPGRCRETTVEDIRYCYFRVAR